MLCTNRKDPSRLINRMQESLSLGLRKWEDMNFDILHKIFSCVPSSDLSRNVSSVCHSWQLGCWHNLCWTKNVFNLSVTRAPLENLNLSTMKLLKNILEDKDGYGINLQQWRLSIETIVIPGDLEISDDHLIYIAERTIGLKSLVLSDSSRITVRGLMKATCNWKFMKFIHLQQVKYHYYIQIIDEISQNCSALEIVCLRLNELHSGRDAGTEIKLKRIIDIMKYGSNVKLEGGYIWGSFSRFDSTLFELSAELFYYFPFNITLKLRGKGGKMKGSYEDDDKAVSELSSVDNETGLKRADPLLVCVSL